MTRDVARRLLFLLLRASSATAVVVVASGAIPACYANGGGGTDPPTTTFYFPVGLAVSAGGNALYAVNSDFDLQWNGGTLQSYDLTTIRRDTAMLIQSNLSGQAAGSLEQGPGTIPNIQFVQPQPVTPLDGGTAGNCLTNPLNVTNPDGSRIALGEVCAPPVQSTAYVRDSRVIGAFATDLQLQVTDTRNLSRQGSYPPPSATPATPVPAAVRLFAPVGGNATLTWADVGADPLVPGPDGTAQPGWALSPAQKDPSNPVSPFYLGCGGGGNGSTCDSSHQTGNNPNDKNDTRHATMPGEPFGMAQTEDGTAIAVTAQSETDTSLLTAGSPGGFPPTMQFVETDLPNGGIGIVTVPHDPDASVRPCELLPTPGPCVRPAFLETNNTTAELDLLRYYSDDGSTQVRPFITKEATFPFTTNFGGTDSRGIAIDATKRLFCKAQAGADFQKCGEIPARVFFANRTPPSLIYGTIGGPSASGDGTFDPDLYTPSGNIPLLPGPSRVYVAPIVNSAGQYEARVFIVNFDSASVQIYNPDSSRLADIDTIYVGPGPFAMAFDPFSQDEMANHRLVPSDPRQKAVGLNTYRFAYVASFTQSFVQVIDLDSRQPTYESVVFTLGNPTPPKGS